MLIQRQPGLNMKRQVSDRHGRRINPLQVILFLSAMLVFIFTVAYRMLKSESFGAAVATLVESLLMVAFFIFLGIVIAYLLYVVYERMHKDASRQTVYPSPGNLSEDDPIAGHSDHAGLQLESDEKGNSQPNS